MSEPQAAASQDESSAQRRKPALPWRRVLVEALLITLGVLLALIADEWRQQVRDRDRAATMLDAIRDELRENRRKTAESLQYHLTLWTHLSKIGNASDAATRPDPRLFSKGFFFPASLLHTAWETANSTEVMSQVEYRELLALARMYEEQRTYQAQVQSVSNLVYAQLFEHGIAGMLDNHQNLSTLIATFWFRECQLLHRYDDLLNRMDDDPAEPLPQQCAPAISAQSAD